MLLNWPQRLITMSSRLSSSFSVGQLLTKGSGSPTEVSLKGWVVRAQKRGRVVFAHLSDGLSGNTVQVVIPKDVLQSVPVGAAIHVNGTWTASTGAQQESELLAAECRVLATDADPRYADLAPDVLRKKAHLRSKNPSFAALLRMRSKLLHETHQFFQNREFVHIDTPVLTVNDCEGAGETFTINASQDADFFGNEKMFLTVSGQLHLEAMTSGISNVYTINGGFRAEKQQSSTHMTEFRMLEAEVAFCESLEEICSLVEDYLRHCANLVENNGLEVKSLGKYASNTDPSNDLLSMLKRTPKLPSISFKEAISLLEQKKQSTGGNGLSRQNELFLVKHFNSPVFVTHFPTVQKPFYMKRDDEDGSTTLSFDLLCPGVGELAGGSVREGDAEKLRERGVGGGLEWYLECRRRGKPVSAGFGIGFERLVQTLLGVKNIKDTIPFPRWYKHCQC